MKLESLNGIPDRAHVAINAKELRGLPLKLDLDGVDDFKPIRVNVGELRKVLKGETHEENVQRHGVDGVGSNVDDRESDPDS